MRILIVDDERIARARLLAMVQRVPGVSAWEQAADAEAALVAIEAFRPDILLLDIHMPRTSGVELAGLLPSSLGVVFVTADPACALQAFEVGAVDYLLKPVRLERLAKAIERVAPRPTPVHRVICRGRAGLRVFDAARIPRFRADQKYTVFTQDDEEYLLAESLDALEATLPHSRVHRSELVDLTAVVQASPSGLVLADGQRAQVSRRRWPEVKRMLSALGTPAPRTGP